MTLVGAGFSFNINGGDGMVPMLIYNRRPSTRRAQPSASMVVVGRWSANTKFKRSTKGGVPITADVVWPGNAKPTDPVKTQCPAGSYNSDPYSCKPCKEGSFTNEKGFSVCLAGRVVCTTDII